MAIDPNQFEIIGDQPVTDGRFELVGDEPKPGLSKLGFDMSKVGQGPQDVYKLQESKSPALEDYSEAVPASLNPNYDFNRATGYGGPITASLGLAADAAGKGIVKLADIPTRISNIGKTPESPGYRETLEEREGRGPILKLPRVDTNDLKGAPAVVAGLENTALGTAESFIGKPSSAFMLPLLGGEGALAKTAAGVYGVSAAAQVPDAVKKAIEVYNDPDSTTAEKTQAISDPIVQGTLSYLMLKHVGSREVAGGVQGPYALGRMMKTPEGAEAPLQVERYEPLDVQSGSPLSPQELIARQSRVPTQPETPTPEIKTHNLDEPEEIQNAPQERQQPENNQPQHQGDGGERTPAESSGGGSVEPGPTQPAQADEPIARTGDARGEPNQEAPQIDFGNLQRPHEAGVIEGLKKTPDDVPDLKRQQAEASQKANAAIVKGDDAAFKSAFGEATYLGGQIEGALKNGPNYDLYMERNKGAEPPPPSGASKARADAVLKHERDVEKAQKAQSISVDHQPESEDGPEIWNLYSKAKGNDRQATVSQDAQGRFIVEDEKGSTIEWEKSSEAALEKAKDYINGGESQEQYNAGEDARSHIIHAIDLPSDFTIKDIQDTKWGSVYYLLQKEVGKDADGEPIYEDYKISIRNHEPSPFREKEFGASDAWFEIPKNATPKQLSDAVSRVENWIKNHSDTGEDFVGMGGAVPSEFNPEGNEARDVYGIAHEVREARERAGQVGVVERGEGISAKDSVEHGRQLLQSGVDPEKALSNFEATGKWSSDDIAVTRAHGERLAQAARGAERKFGTDSPEHKAAFDALTNWDERTKKLQTEWHKAGQAQQGQTDIDTGTFTGLAREFKKQTGKDLTPKQEKEAKDISGKVSGAADATEKAKNELFNQLDKEIGDSQSIIEAERRALDAANKVVREAWIRRAQAETKERVATAEANKKAARAERAKEQKILDLAIKQSRDAAKRLADAENNRRIEEAKGPQDDTQSKAAQKALDAANDVVRESAVRMAKAENDARVAKSEANKKAAQASVKREQKALDAARKVVRDAAARAAKAVREENVLKADKPAYAWKKAKEYIDKGITNFDDIRNGLATDMGLPVAKVTEALAKTKRAKFLTDELWKKQQEYRRLDQNAKRWIMEQQMPKIQKVIQALPNLSFAAKVFGHGTVALGTHAPMVAFQPPFWKAYANNFVKMYRMVGCPAFYEMHVQDLLRKPNYTTARRAGLVNDPYQFEDYNSPEVTKWMGPVASTGNRGYSVLKMLRQDMFDAQWNRLPKTQQIPEVAAALADGINHATGVVRAKAPKGSNVALFAPRLEASRVAWLVGDPARAVKAGLDWGNASDGEKQFAMNQVKEKAWVIGTMLTLLAANEGILEASGSNQRVNLTDPMKRDWMKFKVGGMNISYGNAMLSMARLPARLYRIRESNGGKLKNLVYPDEDTYSVLGEFARSQESPFASLATTLWFKSDWQNRPLPNSNRPVPKRLLARGVKPYTWPEFWTEQALPIPLEEGAREVWKSGLGMSDQQAKQARKAMATIAVMAATGARVEEDTDVVHP